jgi:hypothetical protein
VDFDSPQNSTDGTIKKWVFDSEDLAFRRVTITAPLGLDTHRRTCFVGVVEPRTNTILSATLRTVWRHRRESCRVTNDPFNRNRGTPIVQFGSCHHSPSVVREQNLGERTRRSWLFEVTLTTSREGPVHRAVDVADGVAEGRGLVKRALIIGFWHDRGTDE